MKVVLSGYFGFGNIGDEAILEAMVRGLRSHAPDIEITVLSANPSLTEKAYNVKAASRWRLRSIMRSIKESDVVISGGGGLIQDVTGPFTLIYYLGIIYLAKWYRKKTVIIGQGLGPIKRLLNRIIARWILSKVDLIIVRDEESYQNLSNFGIKRGEKHFTSDVTLMLPQTDSEKKTELLRAEGIERGEGPLIGISIRKPSRRIPKAKAEVYYKTIASALDSLIEKLHAQFIFIPFHYPKDVIESAKIINLMKNSVHIVVREYGARDVMGLIGSMDLFIGMRLHSMIFSAMEGIPMVGVAYDPKVKAFLNSIGQKSINVEDVTEEMFIKLVEDAWENREAIKEKLNRILSDLKAEASSSFEIFFKFFKTEATLNILGIKIDNLTIDEALREIDLFVRSRKPHLVVTPNPEMVVMANKDKDFKEILNEAHLNLPDGAGLLWAAKVFKKPLKEKVSGVDLIPRIAELAERQKYKIYLLGSKSGIAAGAAGYLQKQYPNLKIVGTYHGFFNKEEELKVIENIALTEPDILIVGMGSPKQEKWLGHKLNVLNIPVSIAVGGSLDVLAGKVKRAPKWMRMTGLEWFWRLLRQPWRIMRQWRLFKFVWLVLTRKSF